MVEEEDEEEEADEDEKPPAFGIFTGGNFLSEGEDTLCGVSSCDVIGGVGDCGLGFRAAMEEMRDLTSESSLLM